MDADQAGRAAGRRPSAARQRLLDTADRLFYAHGVQAVGVDRILAEARVTRVTFYRGGRFVTLPVIDRGPFRQGVAWDLTAAAARQLGMATTSRLRSIH